MSTETWNMETLYGNVDSAEFGKDIRKEVKLAGELMADLEKPGLSFPDALWRYQRVLDIDETLQAFASAMRTTDTSSPLYAKGVSQAEEAGLKVSELEVRMLAWCKKRKAAIRSLTKKGASLADYRFVLGEMLAEADHTMSPELENLADDLARSGTEAFTRLQDTLSATSETVWIGEEKKTGTELRGLAFSPDREMRRLAFEKEIEVWKTHAPAFAAALNGVKGTALTLDRRRGWESPLERSLFSARIDRETFNALMETLRDALPMWRRYLSAKAKALGLKKLAFYDLFAPVGQGSRTYTWEEAKAFVVRQVSAFSPKMGSFMQSALEKGWVDPFPRKGKVGGAYDTAFPLFGESRVLTNFDGTYNGVSTLAHELGHAFHDSVVLPLPHLLRTYPMTLAETASTFSEFVTLKGALAEAGKEEKLTLEEHFLQDACQVCVDILSRYEFEKEVFARRSLGELSAEELCAIMEKAQKDTYGPLEAYHPYMWTMKSHYYDADFSYYNYPYAFGELFALGLYALYEKDPEHFEGLYIALLSRTGKMSAMDAAASVGIDIRDKKFWEQGMAVIDSFVKDFIRDSRR